MGLDVYLYSAEAREHNKRHDREWDALWRRKESGEITEEQFRALDKEITQYARHEDAPSKRYPDHLFNRRYLCSSYNDGGFNHAVPDFLSTSDDGTYPVQDGSLYWIFEPMGREWDGGEDTLTAEDVPKLRGCRKRAEDVAQRLRDSDRLCVMTISANQLSREWLKFSDGDALRMYREKAAERPDDDGWWSNRDMNWYGKGLTVLGAVAGVEKQYFSDKPWPAVHLIYRMENEGFDSYVQSAEITAEFCDEAISLIERDGSAYLMWSG